MLKITRKGISLIIPNQWLDTNGFLKHLAVHVVKLFFGDESLEEALEEGSKNVIYGWTFGATIKKEGKKGLRSAGKK